MGQIFVGFSVAHIAKDAVNLVGWRTYSSLEVAGCRSDLDVYGDQRITFEYVKRIMCQRCRRGFFSRKRTYKAAQRAIPVQSALGLLPALDRHAR
jgi:hypothetical protein